MSSKPVTRSNRTIDSSSWKLAWRIGPYLYLKKNPARCWESFIQQTCNKLSESWVSQVQEPEPQPRDLLSNQETARSHHRGREVPHSNHASCKGSAKLSENQNQNKFKKKLKLHPRCLRVGKQNGLISVSLQLSCPAVEQREPPSLPTGFVKTNCCL